MTSDSTRPDLVIVTGNTQTYHRAHPSDLLAPACAPNRRGVITRIEATTKEMDACPHLACFGGED